MKVKCGECGHPAEISAESAVWRCNCGAGVRPASSDCACTATNQVGDAEQNPPDRASEIEALEAQVRELRAQQNPGGADQHG